MLLDTAPSIASWRSRRERNQLCPSLVRWADGKQLAISPQKSRVKLLTSDTHQSWLHSQVWIGNAEAPLYRTPKILGVTLDTHFTLGPHARNYGPLQGHRAPHPQLSRSHLVGQTGQTWGVPEQGSEDRDQLPPEGRGVPPQSRDWGSLPEDVLRTMFSAVLCQHPPTHAPQSSYCHLPSRPQPLQCHPPGFIPSCLERPANKRWRPQRYPPIFRGVLGQTPLMLLRGRMIEEIVWSQAPNKVLIEIDPAEQLLPRSYRSALSQLWSGYCLRLQSYRHSVDRADDPTCPDCHSTKHMVAHLFSCPSHPTDLAPGDMWVAPL